MIANFRSFTTQLMMVAFALAVALLSEAPIIGGGGI
jgi:hypothetical protein